ncbi:MAG: hypothetical protein M3N13_10585 [Candidatus Eremiobacteraeota bacterium]|nr:hypothetical protein [Candidatus Eremiobacteraeota bacterium]
MRRGSAIDFAEYGRALPALVKHPSILAMPLLAAVIDMVVSYTSGAFTDPLGGFGSGIFAMIVQIVYLFAFGVAVIQANNIQRGFKTGFDEAWEEGRRKAGGILMAAFGFQFLAYVGAYIGTLLGSTIGIALQLIAYFFLILTIPAAAIGGLPGGLAISGSFRSVRANPLACIILAVVFVAMWVFVPNYVAILLNGHVGDFAYRLILALVHAIVLAYLAFPFSKTYDNIAFRGF